MICREIVLCARALILALRAGVCEPDGAEAELELALHLGPERGGLCSVGLDEVVGQLWGGVLEEVLAEGVEAVDELGDQRAYGLAVSGEAAAGVGDADADVAHLVAHREPLRLAQPGEGTDAIEQRRDKGLVGAADRALREQVIGDDGSQEGVLVAAVLERAHYSVERLAERGGDGIELGIRERLDGVESALDAEDLRVDAQQRLDVPMLV